MKAFVQLECPFDINLSFKISLRDELGPEKSEQLGICERTTPGSSFGTFTPGVGNLQPAGQMWPA